MRAFGDFQAMNALPCIYIAKACHLKEESILNGLKNLEMTKMRTQLISVKNAYILDDTYKSNPESAKAAIDTLMELPANKHIAILSDMLDLGSEEKQLHYDVGVYAKEKGVDRYIVQVLFQKKRPMVLMENGMKLKMRYMKLVNLC